MTLKTIALYAAILDIFVDSYFRRFPPKISLERTVFSES
jgi:hypothetical protein